MSIEIQKGKAVYTYLNINPLLQYNKTIMGIFDFLKKKNTEEAAQKLTREQKKADKEQWNSWNVSSFGGIYSQNIEKRKKSLIKNGVSKDKAGGMVYSGYEDVLEKVPNFSLAYTREHLQEISELRKNTSYYENGQLKEESHSNYLDEKEGLYKHWHENGELWQEHYYKRNKIDGLCKVYYMNGKLSSESNWNRNGKNGLSKEWYGNGQLESEGNYKDFKEDGLWKWWHENGQLKSEENYKGGEKEGLSKEWHENGQLKSEGKWDEFQEKVGLWKVYFENGQLKEEKHY